MKYNFDELISRRGTNSYKWDSAADAGVLPLWVADMDFRTAPAITEALARRVAHGIFGYTRVPEAYYNAVTGWFARRAIIKALARPGDKVLVQTPVYNCFFSSIRNNGCEAACSPLLRTGDTYRMDFDDLERKAADPAVKLMLLCNPHNPAGRVWTREELTRLGEICLRHDVTVVADEIHCELVFPEYTYTPFASISEEFQRRSVACVSPSKAFNIAGLQIANIVAADDGMRERIDHAININEVCDVNPFGVEGLMAAYNEGEAWLNALRAYLWGNYDALCRFFAGRLPALKVTPLEGTYLVWVDCRPLGLASDELARRLASEGRVMVNSGTMYGQAGEGFIRINIACPRSRMMEGLCRMAAVLG